MRTEYRIGPDTPGRMARAVTRYRARRPAFLVPVVVELLLGVVFAAAGYPGWGAFMAVVALAQPAVLAIQSFTLANAMEHRGYRPGSQLVTDWAPDGFEISTVSGSGRYPYDAVSGTRVYGGAVVMRIRGARVLLVLPAEVVPPAARPRLGLPT